MKGFTLSRHWVNNRALPYKAGSSVCHQRLVHLQKVLLIRTEVCIRVNFAEVYEKNAGPVRCVSLVQIPSRVRLSFLGLDIPLVNPGTTD